jgi:ubiquinone/menaquinone biosynthesis C-methylase UbiE
MDCYHYVSGTTEVKTNHGLIKTKTYLKEKIDEEILLYYKNPSQYPKDMYDQILERWSDDSIFSEKHRFDLLNLLIEDIKSKKILDMAAGCGSFVLQGLRNGYNTHGVEPEDWKQEVINLKFEENNYSTDWRRRIVKGVGEKLPFEDESFDVFDSWQTIEHVADERSCIFELYRVLKKGGLGILRGPDYLSFYEGHYRMFWFPAMGKSYIARFYLRLHSRPFGGLDTFHPVIPFKTKKYAKEAGFKVIDIKRKQIYDAASRRLPFLKHAPFKPVLWSIYSLWDLYRGLKNFGRSEATISYLLIKE